MKLFKVSVSAYNQLKTLDFELSGFQDQDHKIILYGGEQLKLLKYTQRQNQSHTHYDQVHIYHNHHNLVEVRRTREAEASELTAIQAVEEDIYLVVETL